MDYLTREAEAKRLADAEGLVEAGAEVGNVLEVGVGGGWCEIFALWKRGVEFCAELGLDFWLPRELVHHVRQRDLRCVVSCIEHGGALCMHLVKSHGDGSFLTCCQREGGEEVLLIWIEGPAFRHEVFCHAGEVVACALTKGWLEDLPCEVVPISRQVGPDDVEVYRRLVGVHCGGSDGFAVGEESVASVNACIEEGVAVGPEDGSDGVEREHVEPRTEIEAAIFTNRTGILLGSVAASRFDFDVPTQLADGLEDAWLHVGDSLRREDVREIAAFYAMLCSACCLGHGGVSRRDGLVEVVFDYLVAVVVDLLECGRV